MFSGDSDPGKEAARFGIPVELIEEADGYGDKEHGIYPDNEKAVSVFVDMSTQWRIGMSGRSGLDYKALPVVMSIRRVKLAEREDIFNCLMIMERAVLEL